MGNDVLFIGNGIARTLEVTKDWDGIIKKFAEGNSTFKHNYEDIKNMPYSMRVVVATSDNVDKAMKSLCNELKSQKLDNEQKELVFKILNLPFDDILTTNYTYELERGTNDQSIYRCRYTEGHKFSKNDFNLFGYIPVQLNNNEKHNRLFHGFKWIRFMVAGML